MTTVLTINGSVAGFVMSYPCEKQILESSFEQFLEFFTVKTPIETPKSSTELIINIVTANIVKFKHCQGRSNEN